MRKTLNAHFVRAFVADAVERAAVDADDVLWAKADEAPSPEQRIGRLDLAVRENFDGAGEVKCFRITIEEVPQ